ncbi:hypothetical protein [Legionella drancourtii]|uniref:Coiled-coil protein n=1 Tax=Legionella drancourtii LLAP12 TaxID=658187 RepID=G9ETX3_9GAMM|nr:hypothetical protein [Legionella drancourtii]EHL29324.1 hypothetical protein LDG_8759 [Legionella drancourtii LLAP12]
MAFEPAQIADKKDAEGILQGIQQPVAYIPKKKKVPLSLLMRIPFLSRFVKGVSSEAMQLGSSISALHGTPPTALTSGFQFGGISLAALDFLMVPGIYLAAFVLKRPVPITLNNNARWLYSAVLLALAITALTVPGAAPVIGLVSAGLALGLSTFLLAKALRERYVLGKERKALRRELVGAEEEMQQIQCEAEKLHTLLQQTTDQEHLTEIYQHIASLQQRHQTQKERIEALKEKEEVIEEKIKELGIVHIVDKGLGVSLASLAVVGLVTSLFFPHVGLAILIGVSAVSLAYLAVRITVPIVRALGNWLINKFRNAAETEHEVQNSNTLQLAEQQEHRHEQSLDNTIAVTNRVHVESTTTKDVDGCNTDFVQGTMSPEQTQNEPNSTSAMLELLGDNKAVLAGFAAENAPNADAQSLRSSVASVTVDDGCVDSEGETVSQDEGEGAQEEPKAALSH